MKKTRRTLEKYTETPKHYHIKRENKSENT